MPSSAAEYNVKMTMIAMRGCRRPGTFTWVIPFPPPPVPLLPYSRFSPEHSGLQPQAKSSVKRCLLTPSQALTNRLSHVSASPTFWKPPAPPVTTPETPRSLAVDHGRRSTLETVTASLPWYISACSSTAANTDDPSQVMEHVSQNNPYDRDKGSYGTPEQGPSFVSGIKGNTEL